MGHYSEMDVGLAELRDVYGDADAAAIRTIVEAEPSWLKWFIHHHGELTSAGVNRVVELHSVARDVRPWLHPGAARVLAHSIGGTSFAWVAGRSRSEDRLELSLPPQPDDVLTRCILGVLSVSDHRRSVRTVAGSLDVTLSVSVDADLRSALARLELIASHYNNEFSSERQEPQAVEQALALAGVGIPALPADVRHRMLCRGSWLWSTTNAIDPSQRQGMQNSELVRGAHGDQLTIGHHGHGLNSSTLSVHLVRGPLALLAQVRWGGAFQDSAASAGDVTRLLHHVVTLAENASTERPWDDTPRGRDVALMWSHLRQTHDLETWDSDLRTWHTVSSGQSPWSAFGTAADLVKARGMHAG